MKIKINVGRINAGMFAKCMPAEVTAQVAGINQGLFRQILKEGQCTRFTLGKIARALDIPVWELIDV